MSALSLRSLCYLYNASAFSALFVNAEFQASLAQLMKYLDEKFCGVNRYTLQVSTVLVGLRDSSNHAFAPFGDWQIGGIRRAARSIDAISRRIVLQHRLQVSAVFRSQQRRQTTPLLRCSAPKKESDELVDLQSTITSVLI
jgi:hypothetical protein